MTVARFEAAVARALEHLARLVLRALRDSTLLEQLRMLLPAVRMKATSTGGTPDGSRNSKRHTRPTLQ